MSGIRGSSQQVDCKKELLVDYLFVDSFSGFASSVAIPAVLIISCSSCLGLQGGIMAGYLWWVLCNVKSI